MSTTCYGRNHWHIHNKNLKVFTVINDKVLMYSLISLRNWVEEITREKKNNKNNWDTLLTVFFVPPLRPREWVEKFRP